MIFSAGVAVDEVGKAADADEAHRHADRHAQQHQREQRDKSDDGDEHRCSPRSLDRLDLILDAELTRLDNPAVSTAVFLRGRMNSNEYGAYMLTQFVAAILGGLTVRVVGGHEAHASVVGAGRMLIAEFLFTFALAWVVLNVATARGTRGNSFYGLAIGFTVVAGAFAVGGISGGAFNPAIAVGAMVTGLFKWSNIWIYLLAEFLGGAAAAYAFLHVLPAEKLTGDVEAAST